MATETMSNLGSNSAVIEYSGNNSPSVVMSLIKDFILAHG